MKLIGVEQVLVVLGLIGPCWQVAWFGRHQPYNLNNPEATQPTSFVQPFPTTRTTVTTQHPTEPELGNEYIIPESYESLLAREYAAIDNQAPITVGRPGVNWVEVQKHSRDRLDTVLLHPMDVVVPPNYWIQSSQAADKLIQETELIKLMTDQLEKDMKCADHSCKQQIVEEVQGVVSFTVKTNRTDNPAQATTPPPIVSIQNLTEAHLALLPGGFKESFCDRKEEGCGGREGKEDRYPPLDGWCNNIKHPDWGGALTPFNRIIESNYIDDVLKPHGEDDHYPNPFDISLKLLHDNISRNDLPDVEGHHETLSVLFMQWGQFLTHDITQGAFFGMRFHDCLNSTSEVAKVRCRNVKFNGKTWPFAISNKVDAAFCNSRAKLRFNPVNGFSSFIDGTNIYNFSPESNKKIRTLEGGKMKDIGSNGQFCGDLRCSATPLLFTLHELFIREHNRIATLLAKNDFMMMDDETIFQEARRIVIAEMQAVTYSEWLPKVLGPEFYNKYGLSLDSGSKYNEDTNPALFVEFQTAAMRFGHSLVPGVMNLNGPERHSLADSIFVVSDKMAFSQFVRGSAASPCQKVDMKITSQLKSLPEGFLMPDLAAMNIHRGRDHGLPPWWKIRRFYGLTIIGRNIDNELQPGITKDMIKELYSPVNWREADLWLGGLAEKHVQGGQVGESFANIIGEQFSRLKNGDRYFFSHTNAKGLLDNDLVNVLKNRKLSQIICDNFPELSEIKVSVFEQNSSVISCRSNHKTIPLDLLRQNTLMGLLEQGFNTVLQNATHH